MNTLETIRKNLTGRTLAGSILLYLGVLFFLRNIGLYIPDWFTGAPLILLVVGIFYGIRHEFTKPAAYYMIIFGLFFLTEDILLEMGWNSDLPFFPIVIIAIGTHLMLGKNRTMSSPISN
jgi:hypothetical protein